MKPIWLLDIDGVINVVSNDPAPVWEDDEWITGEAQGNRYTWKIRAGRPVCDFIREVHDKGLAEIRWHTTWQHQAQNVADLLDLPTFPVHPAPEYRPGHWSSSTATGTWWKLPAAWRLLAEEQRPLVWTDDDIDIYLTDEQAFSLRNVASGVLLVSPDHKCGLVQKELDKITVFLDSFQGTEEG